MAKAKSIACLDRFIDVGEESRKLLQPIEGYKSLRLVTLEEAIEPIVDSCPDVRRRAYIAKGNCDSPKDGLTDDESAAIFLYTTEWEPHDQCVYVALNTVLRSRNRNKLIPPWLFYIKLLLTALFKLRSCSMTVWRGVRLDLRKDYEVGKTYTWWGFSSCTGAVSVLQSDLFLGQEGKRTMFSIECFNGKKIREHSSFEDEDEILLLPGSQFIVQSHLQPSKKDPDLIIIQLKQVEPPFALLEEPSQEMATFAHMAKLQISTKDSVYDSEPKNKSEASAIPSIPKTNNTTSGATYTSKEPSTKMKESAKYQTKPEVQEFTVPVTYNKYCNGRLCAKCGKCRDWYYTGDQESWKWIQNINNWTSSDWNRYRNDKVYERFIKRDGATCFYYYDLGLLDYFLSDGYYGGLSLGLACLCNDNIKSAF